MNWINNFISGKVPLWQSFWIGGIGGLIILFNFFVFLGASLDSLVGHGFSILISFLISSVLFVLILLGVFRSSNNYSGSKWWSILAKIFFSFFLYLFIFVITRPILFIITALGVPFQLIPILTLVPSLILIIIFWRSKPKN